MLRCMEFLTTTLRKMLRAGTALLLRFKAPTLLILRT